jgi:hypothetical protein
MKIVIMFKKKKLSQLKKKIQYKLDKLRGKM